MKKTTRTLLIVLVLALVLAIGVFATWNQYQGNDDHNGQITCTPPPPVSPSPAISSLTLYKSGSGWSGVDTTPLMETIDGNTYSYVTYNGWGKGTQIAKINCNTATEMWHTKLANGSGNVLATPYLDHTNGIIYAAAVDYFYALADPEFTSNNTWNCTGGSTITVVQDAYGDAIPEQSYATIPNGGTVYQTFNYPLSTSTQTQLTSGIKLASGNSATVTYILTKPDNTTVTLDSKTVTSTSNWTYIEALGSGHVSATGTYKITVSVTGGSAIVDYVTYSRTAPGIKAVDTDGNIVNANVAYAKFGGQINTPITKYDHYLYFGTYNGQYKYYQVNLNDNDPTTNTKVFTGNNHFYWAGAYSDGTNVYFGSDGGYFYKRSVASFDSVGQVFTLADEVVGNITPGNVRSTVSHDDGNLFFTSQGGYLWRYNIASGSFSYSIIGVTNTNNGSSTSTPAITINGNIYIGSYGINHKAIFKTTTSFTSGSYMNKLTATDGLPVQASVIVYTENNTDYVFFTTNVAGGRGYCYSSPVAQNTASWVWDTGSGTFTLQGMAGCGGYLTFGNDSNSFYIIHSNIS